MKTKVDLKQLKQALEDGYAVKYVTDLLEDAYQEGYDDGYEYGDRV
jgi:hypothetical protein